MCVFAELTYLSISLSSMQCEDNQKEAIRDLKGAKDRKRKKWQWKRKELSV